MSDRPTRVTLAYGNDAGRLSGADVRWAFLPAMLVLVVGVALPFGIAHVLRLQYGPHALAQWTSNVAQIEFWCSDVVLLSWMVCWALSMPVSIKRCATYAGRLLAIVISLVVFVVAVIVFLGIMDGPFP
jgi:hypothetical protein